MFKGYRTLATNFGFAMLAAVLTWAGNYDWTEYMSPTTAIIVVSVANMALRFVTTSPVGTKQE